MAITFNVSIPGNFSTGDTSSSSGVNGSNGLDSTNALGDQSGGSSLLNSPLMQKLLQLVQALIADVVQQAGGDQQAQQQPQQQTGSGGSPSGTAGSPSGTGGSPSGTDGTSAQPDGTTGSNGTGGTGSDDGTGGADGTGATGGADGTGGTGGTTGGFGTTPDTNPLVRLGPDSAGANDDGKVSQSEEENYQTWHDDMDHADKLSKQIAQDPSLATPANIGMLTDLNTKLLGEKNNVSVDAEREHRTEDKALMDNYQTDVDNATKAVDPNSPAGAELGTNDAAASYIVNSKYGNWRAANLKDGIDPTADASSSASSSSSSSSSTSSAG